MLTSSGELITLLWSSLRFLDSQMIKQLIHSSLPGSIFIYKIVFFGKEQNGSVVRKRKG